MQGFLNYTYFQKGLQNTLVHPLCRTTENNTSRWFSKRSHSRQWLAILQMIEEEGPLLFAKGVGSLVIEGWQTHAIHAYETLFSSNEWKIEFIEWMHHV